jgi:hypothetical protein
MDWPKDNDLNSWLKAAGLVSIASQIKLPLCFQMSCCKLDHLPSATSLSILFLQSNALTPLTLAAMPAPSCTLPTRHPHTHRLD